MGRLVRAGWLDRLFGFRQYVGLMAQGLQRGLDASGSVVPFTQPSSDLVVRPASSSLLPVLCEPRLCSSGTPL